MLRAIDLARKCRSEPGSISPKVGAVSARDGRAHGEAFRGELAPGEHAEFALLERTLAEKTLAGATLFTTLEPCTARNYPKIASAERLIERRIKRVFIGILDPNDQIRGRGELRLRAAGIEIARFDPDLMPEIEEQKPILKKAMQAAERIERKYGSKNPGWSDFGWGLLSGKMSALAWVISAEWDESLDM
jgi:pyrimidine deaminase RibD-like protein